MIGPLFMALIDATATLSDLNMSPLGFISILRSITKPPAVPWVICPVPSNLAELLRFLHSSRTTQKD